MLPDGFDGDAVELTVVGRCAECAAAEAGAPQHDESLCAAAAAVLAVADGR
jgi:hypothetical protein